MPLVMAYLRTDLRALQRPRRPAAATGRAGSALHRRWATASGPLMRAMILAAGRGERSAAADRPDAEGPAGGGASRCCNGTWRSCSSAGCERIVINHAWLGEQIEQRLGDGSRFGVPDRLFARGTSAGDCRRQRPGALPLIGDEAVRRGERRCVHRLRLRRFAAAAARPRCRRPLAHLVLVDNPPHHHSRAISPWRANGSRRTVQSPHLQRRGRCIAHNSSLPSRQVSRAPLAPLLRAAMGAGQQ